MRHRSLHSALAILLMATTSLVPVACGNAWITASDRETTLAALMSRAEYAYDKSRFDEAAKYFAQALEKDPSYQDARIKLAYALNGSAGLSILDFVARFLVKDSDDAEASAGGGGLALLKSTVGQDPADVEALRGGAYTGVTDLREASERLRKLQQSWEVICPLMPQSVIDSVFQTESSALKGLFPTETCGKLPEGQSVKSAALFAAALQFMAQATDLFLITLDADGDNEIDLAQSGLAVVNKLAALQTEAASTNGPANYGDSLKAINAQLILLQELREQISGEVLNYTLACFTFITVLFAKIPNLPKEILSKIEGAVTKINEGRSKLAEYLSYDAQSPNSTQGAKVKEAAKKAQAAIDSLYEKATPQQKQELDKQIGEVCANFEDTKTDFGLPNDVALPKECDKVNLALHSTTAAETSTSQLGTDPQVPKPAKQSRLWRPIPLPSELNPSSVLAETPSNAAGTGPDVGPEAMTELLRFGEELRRR